LSFGIHLEESLANAKVSARQPWYIGHRSLNRPSHAFFTVTPKNAKLRKIPRKFELIIVQSHRTWCQSKAHMQLPISH